MLRKQFLKIQSSHYRELIDILVQRHCVTQKDIVRACAITPSYLSHVIAGKRQASTTLTRLLEAFVADNGEFERHIHGKPWKRTLSTVPLFAVKANRWSGGASRKQEWHQVDAPANDRDCEAMAEGAS
ncbi:helix-turn-helix transcriptional regulator [Sorangium sp. So ce1014]|uniref:helix-turn-helix domain-containing protein n=1 Tax=Sorangium sp. So ce1014 TaxID=3133326 RepID=UPI003F62BB86